MTYEKVNQVIDELPSDLSDRYDVEPYGRTKSRQEQPSLLRRLKHWIRFYITNRKPCGCTYWCDRDLIHPIMFPDTEIHGYRTITTDVEYDYKSNYIRERSRVVAVCTCEECGQHFQSYVPFTSWGHNYPATEADREQFEELIA